MQQKNRVNLGVAVGARSSDTYKLLMVQRPCPQHRGPLVVQVQHVCGGRGRHGCLHPSDSSDICDDQCAPL